MLLLANPELRTFLLMKKEFSVEEHYIFLPVIALFLSVMILSSSIISCFMSFIQFYVVYIYLFLFQGLRA